MENKIYIIAEIGNNHNGSVDKAKKLIDISAEAGVNAVKFQSFRGLDIVSPKVLADEYPGWNVKEYKYWHEFLDTIALPLDQHQEVIDYTKSLGLDFITTPVSPSIVKILEELEGVCAYKLASMDLNNIGLVKAIADTKKDVIMSTGMGSLEEVKRVVSFFTERKLSILHCISDYPLEPENAFLNNIQVLQENFPGCEIGLSDHSLGHELVVAAIALGATVVEKHITLDRNDPNLAEHHFSLEPAELKELVHWTRAMEKCLSKQGWGRSETENKNKKLFRRSFHYARDIKKGETLNSEDLVFIRPGDGLDYQTVDNILGKKAVDNLEAYSPCSLNDFSK